LTGASARRALLVFFPLATSAEAERRAPTRREKTFCIPRLRPSARRGLRRDFAGSHPHRFLALDSLTLIPHLVFFAFVFTGKNNSKHSFYG
jgi:hypothetical protein